MSAEILQSDPVVDKNLYSGSYTYDGNSSNLVFWPGTSRCNLNLSNQSWSTHTLDATFTFDGVSANATQRVWHVTGLPYRISPPKNTGDHPWAAMEGRITWENTLVDLNYSAANYPRIKSPAFFIPDNINVAASTKITRNNSLLSANLRISLGDDDHILHDANLGRNQTFESSLNATMTSSLNVWTLRKLI